MPFKKDQKIALALGLALAVPGAVLFACVVSYNHFTKGNPVLKLTSLWQSRHLPRRLDAETELDSVYYQDTTQTYVYRLVNRTSSPELKSRFETFGRPEAIKRLCASNNTQSGIFDRGVAVRYRYYDKGMAPMWEMQVDKSDCAKQ